MNISQEDLDRLKSAKSEQEWNSLCDEIKQKYDGYPSDWYAKVLRSGLLVDVSENWD